LLHDSNDHYSDDENMVYSMRTMIIFVAARGSCLLFFCSDDHDDGSSSCSVMSRQSQILYVSSFTDSFNHFL
jgi:hypothetical protein